ncbi:uncharacterized protein [Littorina saxatilis]|uniref:uncharacterized protein isoform X2 n=1 Tax=Littorina saxatilis TaxID=31220 RepID=UPI0038B4551A
MLRFIRLTRQVVRPLYGSSPASLQRIQEQPLQILQAQQQPSQRPCRCWISSGVDLTDGEKKLIEKLRSRFPGAKSVEVSDISGGCGAMYQISIEAEEFRGKKTVQQHRLVNEVCTSLS